ncbi:hypothetical protein [Desulfoscipio gibsoniae]|uniref:DUF3231 family protein n=1 Tax=Desulfoscipio gibsoniae DSM 7213 TaxID=767817 RepID=R4KHG3_9FIRM|nr:hypothetical protein [Desulfoscipio gibsoniae]AGL01087.1 Protein of unknown function (DUF3231) [Desulfoscipio gibsoniae DSM 7213]
MDIMDKIQRLKEIGKSQKEKQKYINVSEVFYVWDILVAKLDIMESVQIIENFTNDKDLKFIISRVVDVLQSGIVDMEAIMKSYGIPFPTRPPAGINTTTILEIVTDYNVYQTLFESIQSFFPILASGFMQSTSPRVRKAIKNHLLVTMELHELLVEYGKIKGYLNLPPVYNA